VSGQPKTRAALDAIHAALLERAEEGQSTLDVVTEHIEAGGSLVTMADEIGAARTTLYRYLKKTYGIELADKLRNARHAGAAALLDRAEETLLTASTHNREELSKSKFLADLLRERAALANPAEFGTKAQTHITLNIGQLHLDAMRQRSVRAAAIAALPETVDAEIVEDSAA
jgi:AraC-like DNA-binding protein